MDGVRYSRTGHGIIPFAIEAVLAPITMIPVPKAPVPQRGDTEYRWAVSLHENVHSVKLFFTSNGECPP